LSQDAQILDLVKQVYGAALDDKTWPVVLDDLSDLFGGAGASFEIIEKKTHQPVFLRLGKKLSFVSSARYFDYYGPISPRVANSNERAAGQVMCDYMILTESEIDADECYTDFYAPMDFRYFISGHFLSSDSHAGVFAVQRSPAQGHVGDDEIALMGRVLPHIQQALDLNFRLSAARQQSRSLLDGFETLAEGVVVVDRKGAVLHANTAADRMFAANDGVAAAGSRLTFSDKAAVGRFESALKGRDGFDGEDLDAGAEAFTARRPNHKPPYLVSVRYVFPGDDTVHWMDEPAALVFIRDPLEFSRLDADLLKQSYGLSPAEASIADALDRGLSIAGLAARRGVSVTTVRSQLYSLMQKLAVNRQTDLARLLSRYRTPF
jgi:DNA-binding CsgD family transcriptional regulator/PAS domain-containing protein